MTGFVRKLIRIERTVSSLPMAVSFYRDALGFDVAAERLTPNPAWDAFYPGRSVEAASLRLGEQELLLTAIAPGGAPYPAPRHSYNLWFQHFAVVTPDIDRAYGHLQGYGYERITEGGPVQLPAGTGSVKAYKFRDPDGHPLEFLQFPPGTGVPQWQQPTSRGTIGIDHSAISVSDADASIDFYRNRLKLTLSGRQTNHGVAQQRLDAVSDARVDVVALNPADEATPHLELLGYHGITHGVAQTCWEPWDIAGDRLVFTVDNLTALLATLQGLAYIYVAINHAALIRDPDGHLLILEEHQ